MSVWLIGAGEMAIEYAKVLSAMRVEYSVAGRGHDSAQRFQEATGVKPSVGGMEPFLSRESERPSHAIVAVGVADLARVSEILMNHGVQRLLIEKPAGLNLTAIRHLNGISRDRRISAYVAYNRRFYESVRRAQEFIDEDEGVLSFFFDFTEWAHRIEPLPIPVEVKQNWFIANSTHVVDTAFFLGGWPRSYAAFSSGSLSWHPSAAQFSGAGVSEGGAPFSYHANWAAPGRWGVQIMTANHRLMLQPLESLSVIRKGTIESERIELANELDVRFKPGLYREVQHFLQGEEGTLCTLSEQEAHMAHYARIVAGGYVAGETEE